MGWPFFRFLTSTSTLRFGPSEHINCLDCLFFTIESPQVHACTSWPMLMLCTITTSLLEQPMLPAFACSWVTLAVLMQQVSPFPRPSRRPPVMIAGRLPSSRLLQPQRRGYVAPQTAQPSLRPTRVRHGGRKEDAAHASAARGARQQDQHHEQEGAQAGGFRQLDSW